MLCEFPGRNTPHVAVTLGENHRLDQGLERKNGLFSQKSDSISISRDCAMLDDVILQPKPSLDRRGTWGCRLFSPSFNPSRCSRD